MALELGFYASIAVAGWLCLSSLIGRDSHRSTPSLAAFGLILAAWTIGELLILDAESPEARVLARRIFFIGAVGLPPTWFWLATCAASPGWFKRRPALVGLAFVVPLFFYSCLYWDRAGRFVAWDTPTPHHGPWFDFFMVHQYVLCVVGTGYFAKAAIRLGRSSPTVMTTLIVGVSLPLIANFLYYCGVVTTDWTPVALGPAGLLTWIALVDSGLTSKLPLDRNEVIDQLDVGVVIANLDGEILSVNAAAERLADLDDLKGRALPEAVAAAEQRPDAMIETRAIALRGRIGIVGHALILTDRTEAEAARRRLELGGRLEALGSLTAGIAHEVNNPLSYIQANLSALESTLKQVDLESRTSQWDLGTREAIHDMAAIVDETQEGVERIRLLVQRLGSVSRTPDLSATAVEVDLYRCLTQAASVATIGRDGEPIRIVGPPDLRVTTIETAVFQILVNLMLNAVQAAPAGNREITATIGLARAGVEIAIADNGPGIAPVVLPKLFDPFFTTKGDGTGLGLSLSYDLARQIGGYLEAANAEGGGAVFKLWLPPSIPEEIRTASSHEEPLAVA